MLLLKRVILPDTGDKTTISPDMKPRTVSIKSVEMDIASWQEINSSNEATDRGACVKSRDLEGIMQIV
jgi:hypothetical protein